MLGWTKADRDNRSMYLNNKIWQWTTEIQRSFGQNFVTGIAYVGSAGSHLDMPVQNWNNPDPGLGAVQGRRPYQFYVDSRTPIRCFRSGRYAGSSPGPTPTIMPCRRAPRSGTRVD